MDNNKKKVVGDVALTIARDNFNNLVTALEENAQSDDPNFSEQADKLIDKLLRFSRPFIDTDEQEWVDIRFFSNEASNMIWQLFVRADSLLDGSTDYYNQLEHTPYKKGIKNKEPRAEDIPVQEPEGE